MQEELEIDCPFCGESITIFVDVSVPKQNYIEDCTVCCRPIQIEVLCEDDAVVSVDAGRS